MERSLEYTNFLNEAIIKINEGIEKDNDGDFLFITTGMVKCAQSVNGKWLTKTLIDGASLELTGCRTGKSSPLIFLFDAIAGDESFSCEIKLRDAEEGLIFFNDVMSLCLNLHIKLSAVCAEYENTKTLIVKKKDDKKKIDIEEKRKSNVLFGSW
jgi:hypothetical protein